MLDLDRFDLDEIATALQDQTDYERRYRVDPETGKIEFWTQDLGIDGQNPVALDELDHLIPIDALPSHVWYQDMEDFAAGISDEKASRRLLRAIQGRGAFRHFKAELHEEYPELLQVWYAFRDTRAERRAVEWLQDNELIDDETADRFMAEHPDPTFPDRARLPQPLPGPVKFVSTRAVGDVPFASAATVNTPGHLIGRRRPGGYGRASARSPAGSARATFSGR